MVTFAQLMEESLYGDDGYYSAGRARTGMRGDYFTAPETGDAFGQMLAAIFRTWEKLNADCLIEAGAGEGRLMESMINGGTSPGEAYVVVERSSARREIIKALKLPVKVYADFSEIKPAPVAGIIFANELIDAFPVHRVRMMNGKLEEQYMEGWSSPSTPRLAAYLDRLKINLPDAYETEINLAMASWLREASSVLSKGILVLIDYGRPSWDYYAEERSGGTLRGFKNHRILTVPELIAAGSTADWTADVDFTSLALAGKDAGFEPLAFMELGTFLSLGIGPEASTLHPLPFTDVKYLLHPEGLGAQFHVLILGKNVDPLEWTFAHNRIGRLGLPR